MTCSRMWKCDVYTFNYVPPHRAVLNFASQLPALLFLASTVTLSSSLSTFLFVTMHLAGPPSLSSSVSPRLSMPVYVLFGQYGVFVDFTERKPIKMDARDAFWRMTMSVAHRILASRPCRQPTSERRTCKFGTGYASIFTSGMTR